MQFTLPSEIAKSSNLGWAEIIFECAAANPKIQKIAIGDRIFR